MEGDCVVGFCGDVKDVAGEKEVGEIEREAMSGRYNWREGKTGKEE